MQKNYEKPLKKLMILLGLLVVSPLVLSIGFKALKVYTESPKLFIGYGLVVIGFVLLIFTVYYGFKTFQSFLDILFDK
ncbi:hypothetical protein [Tenacibaculum sp. IB213877]|uniref:hypothetical protein n=1 Tax=Tenacibaculum sp. IB213877 TaxID=3097351 RepID=UPI002A5A68BF|nr:hypothetical protein [Tenacibaculum sp. IB213877]MDY0779812.1 hypothetical protein [Tenacibaculum sp. IB213877]